MATLAVCPTGAVAEVYSCEIKEWVRVNDEGLVRPAPSASLMLGNIRQLSIRWFVPAKSKRKPFNSNVADYLLIIATFLGISLDAGQLCLKSPGFNPRALTAASGSRPHPSTFSFGAIIAPIIAVAFSGSCSATK